MSPFILLKMSRRLSRASAFRYNATFVLGVAWREDAGSGRCGEKSGRMHALPDGLLVLDAVVFDLDDTLHDDTLSLQEAARHVAATCFDDPRLGGQVAEAYVSRLQRFWDDITGGAVAERVTGLRERLWSSALRGVSGADPELGARCAEASERYRREHFVLWDGVRELLSDLRAHGSRLALLSNGFAETHREKIELLALDPFFDVSIVSDEVGMVKPEPRIFRLVSERLDVAPERTTMVGDRFEKDIEGAQGVGMRTLWVNVRGESRREGVTLPDVTVGSFREADLVLRRAMQTATGVSR
jgi:putative hydrolase of the HAD superfamily